MLEDILQLLEQKEYAAVRQQLSTLNPIDTAVMLEEANERQTLIIFRLLPKELAANTFVELSADRQEALIKAFSDSELEEVIDELYLDDAVDIIEEMPANVVARILRHTDADTRMRINEVLNYPDDCAGSLMTIEYVSLRADVTVADAFLTIRRTGIDKETIYTCYVVGPDRRLMGVVTAKALMLADPDSLISEIMDTNVISVGTLEDKEVVAQTFSKYDMLALPVVDGENRLVGIVTVDDAIDVMEEEATEDIEMMAAITPTDKPYMKTGVFETWRKRIPWLLLLMISATFTGSIIQSFEGALAAYVVLTAFIPMLMDTGGNSGSQASVSVIRALSLGDVETRDIFAVIWKEFRVALLCGVSLAAANFVKILLVDRVSVSVAAVVCITLSVTVVVAKIIGCTLPILAKAIKLDPAVMASPFITTIVDAVSLLVYFAVASSVLGI
ncbi:MAG: magnesium transporter [Firmicutes bacterium]|nr:magnesium transporter [Bacillota bacterium]